MPQKSPINMSLISSQTGFPMTKLHTHSNTLKAVTEQLYHSDETWTSTQKAEVCIWNGDQHLRPLLWWWLTERFIVWGYSSRSPPLVHSVFTSPLPQFSFSALYFYYWQWRFIVFQKKKTPPLSVSMPVYVGKWAGNLPLFVCWDQHTTDFFPTETQGEGVGVKDDH